MKASVCISIRYGTCAVFIFDTDTGTPAIAEENIRVFRKNTSGISLVVIPQARNFEDEIRRACGIKDVRKITGSRSIRDFKRDILKATNPAALLHSSGFDFSRLWKTVAPEGWEELRTDNFREILSRQKHGK